MKMILPYRQRRTIRANTVLMPANLLIQKDHYINLANTLPTGSVLICTPPLVFSKQHKALDAVARYFRESGHLVRTVPYQQSQEKLLHRN